MDRNGAEERGEGEGERGEKEKERGEKEKEKEKSKMPCGTLCLQNSKNSAPVCSGASSHWMTY